MAFDLALWNKFACGPRCLIRIALDRGQVIDPKDLYQSFKSPPGQDWDAEPGAASIENLRMMVADLGLAGELRELDLSFAQKRMSIKNPPSALLLIRKPSNHVLVLRKYEAGEWLVWNPLGEGGEVEGRISHSKLLELQPTILELVRIP